MAESEPITQEQMNEFLFTQIVLMFQGAAWQHLGKVMNPATNKVERDLAQAKNTIDILGMLQAKTKGNLSDNEQKFLEHALYELRMNYIDEANKGPDETEAPGDEAEAPTADAEAGAEESGDDTAESTEAEAPEQEAPAEESGGNAAETAEAEAPKDDAESESKEESG
ncbi:MAG: DUF1844 domain-containing protein [Candidatus Latescibacteria bacterium]|nr:DUF1844 domain-containing protein [Candidatus Latescibacterota bacterium]